jgi:hypothetical protein
MSDLQDIIATSTIRAFNQGMQAEREHIVKLLAEAKSQTQCSCTGCEEWVNAFDYVIARVQNKIPA